MMKEEGSRRSEQQMQKPGWETWRRPRRAWRILGAFLAGASELGLLVENRHTEEELRQPCEGAVDWVNDGSSAHLVYGGLRW